MTNNTGKLLQSAFASIGFGAFIFAASFSFRLPHEPQPQVGRIYPLNEHGYIRFISAREQREREIAFSAYTVFFFAAAVIDYKLDPFKRHKNLAFKTSPPWNHRWGP